MVRAVGNAVLSAALNGCSIFVRGWWLESTVAGFRFIQVMRAVIYQNRGVYICIFFLKDSTANSRGYARKHNLSTQSLEFPEIGGTETGGTYLGISITSRIVLGPPYLQKLRPQCGIEAEDSP